MEVLPGLDTFVLVARLGSMSAAAEELGVPRSTVSRRVSALEAHVGHALLVRTSRGLRPTDAGARLLDAGRPLVAALRDLEVEVRGVGETPRGVLRAAIPPGLGAEFITLFVATMRHRWPELRVEMRVREVPPDLLDEDLDVVLCEGPLPDSPWFVRRLGPADRIVVASRAYLAERGEPELGALDRHDLLSLTSPNDDPYAWPLREGGTIPVTPLLATSDHQALALLAGAGLGLALLPLHVVGPSLLGGALVQVLPAVGREAALLALTAHGRRDFPKVHAFFSLVDEFVARFSGMPG